jgi:hypothetical protein
VTRCVSNGVKIVEGRGNPPVLFGTEKEVCKQDRDRGSGQANDERSQGKETEGIVRPRGEQAR